MVDRRKVNSADEVPKESDRQFLERAGVGQLMKDALGKIIANRPEDPITFLADYFDSIDDNTSLVQRADQVLKMTHHSRPLFESNVRLAYDTLSKNKVGKKVYGVNGTVYGDLLIVLCRNMPEAVTNKLLQKIECSPHEAVPFDVFKSGVFTCCVLQDYVKLAEQLFNSLDIQRTGKANKALCDVVIEQLHTALGSSRKDARRYYDEWTRTFDERARTFDEWAKPMASSSHTPIVTFKARSHYNDAYAMCKRQFRQAMLSGTALVFLLKHCHLPGKQLILESGYNLGVDGLYLALERAISRSQRNASLQTCDQFVVEVSDAFLSKVKKQT